MQYKNNTKQRLSTIQGLRSLKDTLPKNIKKIINNRGQVYSETLNNWKIIAGESLFKVCYPKSFKNSNKFGVSTLLVMVKKGHEVDLEYSKKEIMDRMNNFFGKTVVEKIKFTSFLYIFYPTYWYTLSCVLLSTNLSTKTVNKLPTC